MKLNEIEKIYDDIQPSQINLKSFETKESLNPKLWDKNGTLLPIVRRKLINIAKAFYESLKIDVLPLDILVVGSNASYNWSKYSDIDLHLLMDFSKINSNSELLRNYFDAKKITWSTQHNISLFGYEVELYVQDITDSDATDGKYSIIKNRWIKIPMAKNLNLNKTLITWQAAKYINIIDKYNKEIEQTSNRDILKALYIKVDKLYKELFQIRREGLQKNGEESTANIVFKVLRRSGHLDTLRCLKFKIYDKLESL